MLPMNISKVFSILGPGIVWAATSIGVSHIVQSTRAGADYGFALLGFIILAHIIKYPFFLFGPKYAGLTGRSLLDGYRSIGKWAFALFLILTFITMFFVQSGVTIVTSALAMNLFGDILSLSQWAGLVLVIVCLVLIIGHYKLLNSLLKWMMILLVICSVIAWFTAIGRLGFMPSGQAPTIELTSVASIAFIVALIGWMPTAIEVSVWHSLWTLSRSDKYGANAAKNATADFNIGYATSFFLAVVFLWLGALILFGKGEGFSNSAAVFAGQLVRLYSQALGDWSWLLMAIVTFVALFSTTFAVADGFPQVWRRAYTILKSTDLHNHELKNCDEKSRAQSAKVSNDKPVKESTSATNEKTLTGIYIGSLLVLVFGSWLIINLFATDIKSLLDFVTTVSFVSAPIYAWLNYRVMEGADVPEEYKLKGLFRLYTLTCLSILTLFSLFFLWWRFLG